MIEHLVKEINTCLKNDLQIAALTMALTLPDTCGKAYSPKGRNGERYANWYDDFIATPKRKRGGIDGAVISGKLVYKLRCAMLHESNPGVDGAEDVTKFSLIWRSLASASRTTVERCIQRNADGVVQEHVLSIDIVALCQDICEAALAYYRGNKDKFSFDYRIISTSDQVARAFHFPNAMDI